MKQAEQHFQGLLARYRSNITSKRGVLCVLVGLSACGSIPDSEINYNLTQSKVSFKVVRSVICDAKNSPLVISTVTPAVSHSADTAKANSLKLAKLRGTFVDSDVKFELYEDGRLKSVNATLTGQGEAILKAASTLASTIVPFHAEEPAPTFPEECAFIKEHGGGKPLSITYEDVIDTSKNNESQPINPDIASASYAERVKSAIGELCAVVEATGAPAVPVLYTPAEEDLVLEARQPGWAEVAVMTKTPGGCKSTPPLWKGRVPVAQLGVTYVLPIPRPALFGKHTFGVAFSESGALTSVQYGSSAGAAQALGGLNSLLTIAQGETTAQKVAEVRSEADLIAQQQRLIQCLADPKNCK